MNTSVTSAHGVKGKKKFLPREKKKSFSKRFSADFLCILLASGLDHTPIFAPTAEQTAKVSAKPQQTFYPETEKQL